jgi:hypothetical protein
MMIKPKCRYCGAGVQTFGDVCSSCSSFDPPDPDSALTFDEVEVAGLDGTLRNM